MLFLLLLILPVLVLQKTKLRLLAQVLPVTQALASKPVAVTLQHVLRAVVIRLIVLMPGIVVQALPAAPAAALLRLNRAAPEPMTVAKTSTDTKAKKEKKSKAKKDKKAKHGAKSATEHPASASGPSTPAK